MNDTSTARLTANSGTTEALELQLELKRTALVSAVKYLARLSASLAKRPRHSQHQGESIEQRRDLEEATELATLAAQDLAQLELQALRAGEWEQAFERTRKSGEALNTMERAHVRVEEYDVNLYDGGDTANVSEDVAKELADQLESSERRIVELWRDRLLSDARASQRLQMLDRKFEEAIAATRDSTSRALEEARQAQILVSAERSKSELLESRVREAETAAALALGSRGGVERRHQRVSQKVAQLRQALEAVGIENNALRDMTDALAIRYQSAVAEIKSLRTRRLLWWCKHAFVRLFSRSRNLDELQDLVDISSSIFFDASWYLERYPDVREAGHAPATHFLRHGANELRDPGPWFSTEQYLRINPDVALAGANPLLHFVRHGQREGRSTRTVPLMRLPPTASAAARSRFSCVFICGEPESAGHRYRIEHLMEAAEVCDAAASWVRADDLAGRLDELAGFDVAIFWRVAWTEEVAAAVRCLRANHRQIVFDIDDLMTEPDLARLDVIDGIRSQGLTEEIVREHYGRVRRTMMEADVCVTTTEELAFYLRWAGKTTHVLPNGFDRQTHDRSRTEMRKWRARMPEEIVRIGYAGGSRTHQRDFAVAAEALAQLLREERHCRLVLFRSAAGPLLNPAEFAVLEGLEDQIEWREAVALADLPRELARFDINIAPLELGNPFCEAKSELKYFEAALVEVPTIASPTGPFRRAIRSGETGFLAVSGDDWYRHLKELVNDPDLRRRVAHMAYLSSLARFGPETRALRLGCLLEQLKGGAAAARGFALGAQLAVREPSTPMVFPSTVVFEQDKRAEADVTVVVPLYNYEGFIEETLDSVRAQTAASLDLVIVDGFSTDDSLAVACAWAERNSDRFNRIVVLQNNANYGLGFCRNSGVDAAETPYVLFLDADNKLLPEACVELASRLRQTQAAFAYSTLQQFGASSALMGNIPYAPQRLVPGNYIDAMALVSKEAWAIAGGIHHVRHGWEDYDFWCRLAELGLRGEWIERPLALYRVHAASMQTIQTTVPENHRRLANDFKARHPWTSLIDLERSRTILTGSSKVTSTEQRTRLDRLLPILRCPETHHKLAYNADRTSLVSFDGLRQWPILDQRPLLSHLTLDAEIRPEGHISNFLPPLALEMISQSPGYVLNLSAGGTEEKFENVVEVEFALFRHTDVAADAHNLPFDDGVFDAVISLNAFEHYHDPQRVASEIRRVLRPGGRLLVLTAFMQPVHEKPWHFYNCTRYGLEEWFRAFEVERISVTDNFSPNYSLGWIASEAEAAVRLELGKKAADAVLKAPVGEFVRAFRDPAKRAVSTWQNLHRLSEPAKETIAAGFEFLGRKPESSAPVVK